MQKKNAKKIYIEIKPILSYKFCNFITICIVIHILFRTVSEFREVNTNLTHTQTDGQKKDILVSTIRCFFMRVKTGIRISL